MRLEWLRLALCAIVATGTLAACEVPDDTGDDTGSSGDSSTPVSDCLKNITNYNSAGPFKVTTKTANTFVKMWVPGVPSGCKVPVISFANGTTATCSMYASYLNRLATHGFLTVCYENTNTGAGDMGITAIQTAFNNYPNMVDYRIGSTGHSQGGQASFIILQKAEAKWGSKSPALAGLAIEPASGFGSQPSGGTWQSYYGKIKSPMFMFSGVVTDGLVPEVWVGQAFAALSNSVEAYWWAATGATHIPVPNALSMEVGVPWFRWKLLGDQKACQAFKNLKGLVWAQRDAQNEKSCN